MYYKNIQIVDNLKQNILSEGNRNRKYTLIEERRRKDV